MAQNNENIKENYEYNKIDQMYEECLNYLQSVKNKYRALAQVEDDEEHILQNINNDENEAKGDDEKISVEDLNGGLQLVEDNDGSEIELLEFYNKEMINNEAVNEGIKLQTDANKINDLEKKITPIKDNTERSYENINNNKSENSIIEIFQINKVSTENITEAQEVMELKENVNRINVLHEKLNAIKNNSEGLYENVNKDNKGIAVIDIFDTNKEFVKKLNQGDGLDDSSNLSDVKSDEILITIGEQIGEIKNDDDTSPLYESIAEKEAIFKIENEKAHLIEIKSERMRRLSEQLPRIIITQSNSSLDEKPLKDSKDDVVPIYDVNKNHVSGKFDSSSRSSSSRYRSPYIEYPKRLVSKHGVENVALISNVPYGKLRLLNDTFHTLINLRWRWIVTGTVVVHFTIWFVFAVFWYIASLAHYDFEPDPPQKACITGGKDFVTIFLASVEAQTTIGFGDRTIDEECPESIFLFIMQLILGTGLSGVLTCVVYAKLTRPEKLSRDGVGFSKKAVICMRDGKLCLMLRAWDLNYDHLISSDFSAHFVKTYRTKEGEYIRYYARTLDLQQRQFLLWPVTIVHVIDENSPLYNMTPENFINFSYEITISLKGASASMGTYTQSQTSYLPREVLWGYRFPSVVKYDHRKRKYVIDGKKLDRIEQVDTPLCSANQLYRSVLEKEDTTPWCPGTPSSFSEKVSEFKLDRGSSFRRKH